VRRDGLYALVRWMLAENHNALIPNALTISIDDSKSPKPKASLHFEVTGWHLDTNEGRGFEYGVVFITVHIVPLALRLYLRKNPLRKINRARAKGKRLPFKSKLTLAKEILKELASLLPKQMPL
jgi:hypothetical protein